ncbi:MAG TPA: zf-HC2 domain-containing protein, partial [Gemmatimonadales bacterium]|nr:zf-HC2 domain-containing protein [Gemmatimonadales bacterium]
EAVLVLLWEYLDDELGAEEAEEVGAHLSFCPQCRPAYCYDRSLLRLLARQRNQSAPPVLVTSILTLVSTH